jgi:hypothetical protein
MFFLSWSCESWAIAFSLGGGNWSAKPQGAINDFYEGKFARLSHEGSVGGNFLYVVSVGMNLAKLNVDYQYKQSGTLKLPSELSLAEARLGAKYLVSRYFYMGAGALLGDYQLSFDRDDYVAAGGDTEYYQTSENQNYLGHYYEAGLMLLSTNFGMRLGVEANSASVQKDLATLGQEATVLNSTKVYVEVLWKNK